ncbi:MAG TPA: 3-mercaptopyruvate sulfurtransferase [Paracoccaceae bacterium]|nr:3-mercaptopyruvate sulfurtransferase [Paracoccaceae bacterium]
MPPSDPQLLVPTDWLEAHLGAPDLRILDAAWHLPDSGRNAKAEYLNGHIPGALFFDIDDISDHQSALPHMAPPQEKFISRMRAMGVGDGYRVVIYDSQGIYSAARAWWIFRLFGKTDVAVLDGGLPKWIAEGRPLEEGPVPMRDRHFTARRNAALVRDVTQVARAAKLGDEQIVDARSPGRFRGEEPEPRPGLRPGHIPGARNLHYRLLLNEDGTMRDEAGLRAAFAAAGLELARPVITTCGSGVTAAIINLALERLGHRRHALYDGSWAEWGMYKDLKVATGA